MSLQQWFRRFTKGYIYDLQDEIISFTLPRLKQFAKDTTCGNPMDLNSNEEWQGVLALMIHAMELYLVEYDRELTEAEVEIIKIGMGLFHEYFGALWN